MKSIFHALNRLKVFRGLTEQEFAWVLYDVGNSAFTMLSCSLIPIWFKSLAIGTAPGQINSHQATAYYSIAVAVVTVIVAILGPIFGVLADHKDKKKVLFTTAATLGIFGCILNGFITGWLLFLILFVFTKICYSASLTIYDSMLNAWTRFRPTALHGDTSARASRSSSRSSPMCLGPIWSACCRICSLKASASR